MAKEKTEEKTIEKDSKVIKLETIEEPKAPVLTPEQAERVKVAEKELEEFLNEMEGKKYAVGISTKEGKQGLLSFIANQAKWKFSEALGIIEAIKAIEKTKIKNSAMLLGTLEIEAVYYFCSKHEGVGKKEAEAFLCILKPINGALESIRGDRKRGDIMMAKIEGLKQGLELPSEILSDEKSEKK